MLSLCSGSILLNISSSSSSLPWVEWSGKLMLWLILFCWSCICWLAVFLSSCMGLNPAKTVIFKSEEPKSQLSREWWTSSWQQQYWQKKFMRDLTWIVKEIQTADLVVRPFFGFRICIHHCMLCLMFCDLTDWLSSSHRMYLRSMEIGWKIDIWSRFFWDLLQLTR